jgi:NAD(P)H-flavin reductase
MIDHAPHQAAASAVPMQPEPFRIIRVRRDNYDTFTLELRPANGHDPFHFEPGQFNMLYIFGVGEIPISISGDPGHPEKLIHTIRVVGTVTKAMGTLKVGDWLGVRGPFGTAWPVKAAQGNDLVFVAGGIGLAPLRPALHQALTHREQYGKIVLIYGARTPANILYRKELEKWRARFDLDVYVTVDLADEKWYGDVGVVTRLIPNAPFDPEHTIAMTCGPEVMMRYTATELLKRGVEAHNIYVSMERNMKCGIGLCGHCQLGPTFICKDGPVYTYETMRPWLALREV